MRLPPNHSGFNGAEEARIHKGLYESRPRLVGDQIRAVAKAKEKQRRLDNTGQHVNSHQGGGVFFETGVKERDPPMPGVGDSLEYNDRGGGMQADLGAPMARAPVYYPQVRL